MTLRELIHYLKGIELDKYYPVGIGHPHSYRGYYERLAFEPFTEVSGASMLAQAEKANGNTYTGWKGGEYWMGPDTLVHLATQGHCGPLLTKEILDALLSISEEAENAS